MNPLHSPRTFRRMILGIMVVATAGIWWAGAGHAGSGNGPKEVPGHVRFERVVIEPQLSPNGHKPEAIGDLDGDGDAGRRRLDHWRGFKLVRGPHLGQASDQCHDGRRGPEDAQAVDIDNDGDLDIVVSGVQWFENPLRQGKRPDQGPWKAHDVAGLYSHDVIVGDIDQDGKVDIAASSAILLQRGPDTWETLAQPQIERGGDGTALGDIDGDGDLDLLAPTPDMPYQLAWFENPLPGGKPATRYLEKTCDWTRL